jgi:hypothetical protein
MFELQNHEAKFANFNPRAEKHGDDNKMAGDIKVELTTASAVLDTFDKKLRTALFRKASSGEQQDLIEGGDGLVAVTFPRLTGGFRWDEEFPGYVAEFRSPLGLAKPITLDDVTVRKIAFEPLEGGSVAVSLSLLCHPDPEVAGLLCALIQSDVQITLTAPSAEQKQAA